MNKSFQELLANVTGEIGMEVLFRYIKEVSHYLQHTLAVIYLVTLKECLQRKKI